MKLIICHDTMLHNFLASRGFNHQASGLTPVKKSKYWVYYETPAYEKLLSEYQKLTEGGGQ